MLWKEKSIWNPTMAINIWKIYSKSILIITRNTQTVLKNFIPQGKGYGRFHYQENIQFCRKARGSLYELLDHLNIALDEKYINENKYKKFREQIFDIIRMLNGYIRYLKNKKDKGNSTSKFY